MFIEESIGLFRRLREPADEGVKILATEDCAAEGKCPVCEFPLDASSRACKTCATRHHPDCWDYFGGCATYACDRRGGSGNRQTT